MNKIALMNIIATSNVAFGIGECADLHGPSVGEHSVPAQVASDELKDT